MHHHMSHNHSGASGASTALAFVVGVAAGITAGMLLTPRSGAENRQLIKDKAHDARRKAMHKVEEQKHMAADKLEKMSDKAKRTADNLSDKAHDVIEDGRELADEARTSMRRATARSREP